MFATIGSLYVFKTWDRIGDPSRPSWPREAVGAVATATNRRPPRTDVVDRPSP